MHYSLTSCQLYFLVPLSSFLAHLLALSNIIYNILFSLLIFLFVRQKKHLPDRCNIYFISGKCGKVVGERQEQLSQSV